MQGRTEKGGNLFSKALRELGISILSKETGNPFPKCAIAHQCLPPKGWFLKGSSRGPFPGLLDLSYRSHLCCVSLLRVQRPPVFLSWHSPLKGMREALQMSLGGCIVRAAIKTKKPALGAVVGQMF